MSRTRLVVTAVIVGCRPVSVVAAEYGVSRSWLYELVARYRVEGDRAFEPHSRRPRSSPTAIPRGVIDQVICIRTCLDSQGLDAGPDTIRWHLACHYGIKVSRASVARILTREGLVTPEPRKRPRATYLRFEAAQPNECWQSDFTHYPLTNPDGSFTDMEILSWIDDCTRYALHVSVHKPVTGMSVVDEFKRTVADYGTPVSVLTDNGFVYTTRLAGGKGGRNGFETLLRELNIIQKNGHPWHPQTQGKIERFQQTLKKWLTAQSPQPANRDQLQTLIDEFITYYNQQRPHRSLPGHATPTARYTTLPKASPTSNRDHDTHYRVRTDVIDSNGKVTLRIAGKLIHIGIGRTHARTPIKLLIQDLQVTIINTDTGEVLRKLTIDPTRNYQPQNKNL